MAQLLTAWESAALMLALFGVAFAVAVAYDRAAPLKTEDASSDRRRIVRRTMGGVLIVLACLKLARLGVFAELIRAYDPIAYVLPWYGFVYPFIELGIGLALWTTSERTHRAFPYVAAIVIFAPSLAGVVAAMWRAWRSASPLPECGCMGGVFRMPLSHTTLAETSAMLGMAVYMLLASPTPYRSIT